MIPYVKRLAAALMLATAAAHADKAIDIEAGWIRHVPGDRPMAGYFVVQNKGDRHRRLTGASSPVFGSIQIHESVERDGVATMRRVAEVVVPALDRVKFAPGGYHLMLMRRRQPLEVGDEVPVTLEFADGGSQAAVFIIEPTWRE